MEEVELEAGQERLYMEEVELEAGQERLYMEEEVGHSATTNAGLVAVLGSISAMCVLLCFVRQGFINYKARRMQKQLDKLNTVSQPRILQHDFDKDSSLWF